MHGYQLGAGRRESNGVRVMSGQYDNAGDGSMSPHPGRCSRPRASVAVGVSRSWGLRPLQAAEEFLPRLPRMLCGGSTVGLQLCHQIGVDHGRLGVCISVKGEKGATDVGRKSAATRACSSWGVSVTQRLRKGHGILANAIGLAAKVDFHPFREGRPVWEPACLCD